MCQVNQRKATSCKCSLKEGIGEHRRSARAMSLWVSFRLKECIGEHRQLRGLAEELTHGYTKPAPNLSLGINRQKPGFGEFPKHKQNSGCSINLRVYSCTGLFHIEMFAENGSRVEFK